MRVLVVAAGTMAQAGMAALVESIEGLEVAAAVGATAALGAAGAVEAEICLVDLEGENPLDGRLAALVAGFGLPVVAVCESDMVEACLAVGARGAVSPGVPPATLGAALFAALAGVEVVYPPREAAAPAAGPAVGLPGSTGSLMTPLTPRELEVLQLLPTGLTNQQMAVRLGISEHTAKFHVSSVLGKLGSRNRAEAVSRGLQLGLISV